jgi:DNA recombination protein RmuC
MEGFTFLACTLVGLVIGAGTVFLFSKGWIRSVEQKSSAQLESFRTALTGRLVAVELLLEQTLVRASNLDETNRNLQVELMTEKERRAAAEEKNTRVSELDEMIRTQEEAISLKTEKARLKAELENATKSADARLEAANKHFEEKLSLLIDAREEFTAQFKNLANGILETNAKRFTEQNRTNIDALLKPLSDKIKDFEKKVEDTYDKESKQRFSLESEIRSLRQLNTQISQDAVNLTNALKGKTKTQGTWGEFILERVLESSGLVKGREYDAQLCDTDVDGRRMQPDVIVHLPEDRHLIIDSKVNLRAYEQCCTFPSGSDRDEAAKRHIQGLRRHIDQLSTKEYQNRFQINSVDFVMMFVPIESAYSMAVELDSSIFDEALRKRIVIVTPSTLHAMLRTIASIWRQEYQSRNAIEIAQRSGALYDKFVGFTKDLEELGDKLRAAQRSYDEAHKKLCHGQGNLVSRSEKLRELGAMVRKRLSASLVSESAAESLEKSKGEKI